MEREKRNYFRHEKSYKQAVIREIEAKNIGLHKASIIYEVPYSTLFGWKKEFGSGINIPKINVALSSEDSASNELYKENKALRKALEIINTKVIGLETMIDIAEKELQIDIRKKSGSKR